MEADRLVFQAFTATGWLYDGFELARQADGTPQIRNLAGISADQRAPCHGDTRCNPDSLSSPTHLGRGPVWLGSMV